MVRTVNAIYNFSLIQQKNWPHLKVGSVIFINFEIQECTTFFHKTLCLRVLIMRHEIPEKIKKQCISTEHCQTVSVVIISVICKIYFLKLGIITFTSKVVFK